MKNFSYQTREVRDLAWACFSKPMIDSGQLSADVTPITNCALVFTTRRKDWLQALDAEPGRLQDFLSQRKNRRLGLYFEALWHFFLQEDTSVDFLAHNLPVRENGRTLGEFDCLYFCHERQRHVHLELAVKFFLGQRLITGDELISRWDEWWGPECRDTLDLKLKHLAKQQIRLSDQPAAAAVLENLGITRVLREVEVKGYLFQPHSDKLPPPLAYSGTDITADWVHLRALKQYCQQSSSCAFLPLDKSLWLSPALREAEQQVLAASELELAMRTHLATSRRARMVAALDETGRECGRFFVVGDNWPDQKPG